EYYDPMCIPDPGQPDFRVADLSLPKSVSEQAVHSRQAFLEIVDQHYRDAYNGAARADMDGFTAQAWNMDIPGLGGKPVHVGARCSVVGITIVLVHNFQKSLATVHGLFGNRLRKAQIGHAEIRLAGVRYTHGIIVL